MTGGTPISGNPQIIPDIDQFTMFSTLQSICRVTQVLVVAEVHNALHHTRPTGRRRVRIRRIFQVKGVSVGQENLTWKAMESSEIYTLWLCQNSY